jgi:hypothetical protein
MDWINTALIRIKYINNTPITLSKNFTQFAHFLEAKSECFACLTCLLNSTISYHHYNLNQCMKTIVENGSFWFFFLNIYFITEPYSLWRILSVEFDILENSFLKLFERWLFNGSLIVFLQPHFCKVWNLFLDWNLLCLEKKKVFYIAIEGSCHLAWTFLEWWILFSARWWEFGNRCELLEKNLFQLFCLWR